MKTLCVAVLTGGLMLALAGCDQKPVEPMDATGVMQVHMIDAPAAYDAVNIVIDSVQAQIATADSTSGWVTLNSTPGTYNLLVYVNGNFAVIANSTLPVGRYSQIRLFVGSGSTVVVDAVTYPLNIPSGVETGVKLLINAEITSGATTTITLDFDANLSVVQSGPPQNPSYSLVPVIRTTTTENTGSIAGSVSPATSRATVWLYGAAGSVLSTSTDASGGFRFSYLNPGTYTLSVMSTNSLYAETRIVGVSVTSSATADVGIVTLSQK